MKNRKLSMFVIAGIVALTSVAATIMLNDHTNQEIESEPSDVGYPYDIPFWQGVPTLAMNLSPSDRTNYHELDPKEFPWLQRLVENSETIVNDREIKEFFDISEDNYLYKVNGEIYTIHYVDNPTVRLDEHYIKVFPLDELSEDSRIVSMVDQSWLQKGLSNPYKWIPISESELNDYKSFTDSGRKIAIGNTGYDLRYIGADSPELQKAEFKDIVQKSIGIFEEMEN